MENKNKYVLDLIEVIQKNERNSRYRLIIAMILSFSLGVSITYFGLREKSDSYFWELTANSKVAKILIPQDGQIISQNIIQMKGVFYGKIPSNYQLRVISKEFGIDYFYPMVGEIDVTSNGNWSSDLILGIQGKFNIYFCLVKDKVGNEIDMKASKGNFEGFSKLPEEIIILDVREIIKS